MITEGKKKIFLLDSYALIYRAYFAFIKNPRINSKGLDTSAVYGYLNSLIEELTVTKSSNEWVEKLEKVGVPCGPINSIDKVFEDPQVKHLGIAQSLDTIPFGETELVGQPFNLSRTPSSLK